MFALLFEDLLRNIQEESITLLFFFGGGGLRGTKVVNKHFVNKLAFPKHCKPQKFHSSGVCLPKGPSRSENIAESELRYGEEIRYGRSKTLRRGLRKRGRKAVEKVKNYIGSKYYGFERCTIFSTEGSFPDKNWTMFQTFSEFTSLMSFV